MTNKSIYFTKYLNFSCNGSGEITVGSSGDREDDEHKCVGLVEISLIFVMQDESVNGMTCIVG